MISRLAPTPKLEANWHALKAREKGRASAVVRTHRACRMWLAGKVLNRTAAFADELGPSEHHQEAVTALDGVMDADGLGEVLLAMVAIARERGRDAEGALRSAARRRMAQVRVLELQAERDGT
jgi:XTP/dITP diphosphohydrolase